jgi:hypothetical protein
MACFFLVVEFDFLKLLPTTILLITKELHLKEAYLKLILTKFNRWLLENVKNQ